MGPHVIVVGNIGAGKSTTLARLAPALGVPAVEQPYEDNPFLTRFYADPGAWAFRSQLWFTVDAIERHQRVQHAARGGLQEQSVQSTHAVMTGALHAAGLIDEDEHATLGRLVASADALLRPPDLVLHLRASTGALLRRIRARGRPFEAEIDEQYLQRIDDALAAFAADWSGSVLEIDTERVDVRASKDLDTVAAQVRAVLQEGQAAAAAAG